MGPFSQDYGIASTKRKVAVVGKFEDAAGGWRASQGISPVNPAPPPSQILNHAQWYNYIIMSRLLLGVYIVSIIHNIACMVD